MIVIDSLLWKGLRFVFDKIADAVEAERDDESALREELLAAQMKVELGEMSDDEYAEIEQEVVARLSEIRARREGGTEARGAIRVDERAEVEIEEHSHDRR